MLWKVQTSYYTLHSSVLFIFKADSHFHLQSCPARHELYLKYSYAWGNIVLYKLNLKYCDLCINLQSSCWFLTLSDKFSWKINTFCVFVSICLAVVLFRTFLLFFYLLSLQATARIHICYHWVAWEHCKILWAFTINLYDIISELSTWLFKNKELLRPTKHLGATMQNINWQVSI